MCNNLTHVIAETVRQELVSENVQSMSKHNASRNKLFQYVGLWISQKIKMPRKQEKQVAVGCDGSRILEKLNEDLKKKIQIIEETLSLASKTSETSFVDKLREEVACFTNDFGNFLESSKTLTTLLKFHQHPHDKSDLGFEKGTTSFKSHFPNMFNEI
ncbi:hypothetical protein JHK85_023157 [Glycine max]|nr:hypothetical protein JHK85_023157 [Glycine max]